MKIFSFLLLAACCLCLAPARAQQKDGSQLRLLSVDSIRMRQIEVNDSIRRHHSPRSAAIRSALFPGLGQIYNKKYWKVPIVWGALGITGGIFNYNLKEYRKVRFAYFTLLNKDVANYTQVAPELQVFIQAGDNGLSSLRTYRNEFRKNIDYSVLFFLLFWGLNVVDATVDAHLKGFDVSNEFSLKIQPSLNTIPNGVGLSLVIGYKDKTASPRHYVSP
jgi:hypothetical protein